MVDFDHMPALAYDAAEGALGTDPAEGLLLWLPMEFSSATVAAGLGELGGSRGMDLVGMWVPGAAGVYGWVWWWREHMGGWVRGLVGVDEAVGSGAECTVGVIVPTLVAVWVCAAC